MRPLQIELPYLNPSSIKFATDTVGRLSLRVEERLYLDVKLVCSHPLTKKSELISVMDSEGKEIGILKNLEALDADSAAAIRKELDHQYFFTYVTRICSVSSGQGLSTVTIETERGTTEIYLKERGNFRFLPGGTVLMTDVHGLKFLVDANTQMSVAVRSVFGAEVKPDSSRELSL